jgi:hypothetical protein
MPIRGGVYNAECYVTSEALAKIGKGYQTPYGNCRASEEACMAVNPCSPQNGMLRRCCLPGCIRRGCNEDRTTFHEIKAEQNHLMALVTEWLEELMRWFVHVVSRNDYDYLGGCYDDVF